MPNTGPSKASHVLNELARLLRNPVIKLELCPSEEVTALQREVTELTRELERQKERYAVLERRYGHEVGLNCQYEDLFRAHGIRFRRKNSPSSSG